MGKKIYNVVFIVLFLAVLTVPLLFTNWSSGGVSEDENRTLAAFPNLTAEGRFNQQFTGEFETWFMDHVGLRQELITANATLQYKVFDRMLTKSDYMIGRHGDINYATQAMMMDYVHMNLRTEEEVAKIGQSYQTVSDWLADRGIPFYYAQCYDKHSIYPEQFVDTVRQIGDISKTDQVISYLEKNTNVNTVSFKPMLLSAKSEYEVYSNWGDPTHWSPRGAYLSYRYLMERLNEDMEGSLRVLQEEDYHIIEQNVGITVNQVIHEDDMVETFVLKDPKATKADYTMTKTWKDDRRHSVWTNPNAGNDTKLLLMCDSYFNSFLIDDFAESFAQIWVVWGDYTGDLPQIVEELDPDLVIYECAERVDRSGAICDLADALRKA